MFPGEVRYLNIVWSDPETVIKLDTSREILECERSVKGWHVNTTTFPGTSNTVGIKVTDITLVHPPYIELADGTRNELLQVKAPGQKDVWWIHSDGWSPKHKRHLSELNRTAGRAEVVVQNEHLTLLNHTFNFTVYELEQYLADFKNNLWMLILDNASTTRAGVSKTASAPVSEDLLKLLHKFIQSTENLIQKPNIFLSETQDRLPLRSVKPVGRTFREFAVNPYAKTLTSRSYQESYDTSENRFVHHCVDRVRYLLNALLRTVAAQRSSFEKRITQEKEWVSQLKEKEFKRVNPKVYDNEIATLQSQISELDRALSRIVTGEQAYGVHCDGQLGEYSIVVGGEFQNAHGRAFFGNQLNGVDFRQAYDTYLIVWLPENMALPKSIGTSSCELNIRGRLKKSKRSNFSGAIYYEIAFKEIHSVSIVKHPWLDEIARLHAGRSALEKNDWRAPLSKAELRERESDICASEHKLAAYQNMNQLVEEFDEHLPRLKSRIGKLQGFFNQHGVKKISSCPNSMTFIQNPAYAGVKRYFKKVMAQNSLNESLLKSLMVIDDIGLVNISNLYERWCLIQIIKVLTESYGFVVSDGWQEKLVNLVLNNQYNIELYFTAPQRHQEITLTYEMVLQNGKRPDFVLDLFSKKYHQDDRTSEWSFTDDQRFRLVIDAKFRGDVSENHINKLGRDLYNNKDYGEGGANKVFIVHPTPEVIQNMTSPLGWGEYCDYGQTDEHKIGSVFISPTKKYGDTVRNLQRLIGMFLQENSAILKSLNHKRGVQANWTNIACISCGNTADDSLKVLYVPTSAGSDRWEINCGGCGLVTVKTICSSCYRPLFKNGLQWTYHRTRAEQISNVVCPSCNKFL